MFPSSLPPFYLNFFHIKRIWQILHTDAIHLNYPKSNCLTDKLRAINFMSDSEDNFLITGNKP